MAGILRWIQRRGARPRVGDGVMWSDMTGPILEMNRRWVPWTASLAAHLVIVSAFVLPTGSKIPTVQAPRNVVIPLVYWPPVKAPRVIGPSIEVVRTRPRLSTSQVAHRVPVKEFRAFVRQPPRPVALAVPDQVLPLAQAPTPVHLAVADLPSRPAPVTPKPEVRTDVFGSSGISPSGHVPANRLEVHTGGFGGSGGSAAASVTAGGNGRDVHTGGFGDSTGSGGQAPTSGSGRSMLVADAGFGNATAATPSPHPAVASAPSETPVEVLWKPKPLYTEEARAKKLEGNVTLEVIFRSTGEVKVVRVVRGLGFGLDESARSAAERIRFRPGTKDGVPVDLKGLVLITFELS